MENTTDGNCAKCGASGATKRCAACKKVKYCSRECQKIHWKGGHKRECSTKPTPQDVAIAELRHATRECECYDKVERDRRFDRAPRAEALGDPMVMASLKVRHKMDGRDLDLDALRSAFEVYVHPFTSLGAMTLVCRRACQKEGRDDMLDDSVTVAVGRDDRSSEPYFRVDVEKERQVFGDDLPPGRQRGEFAPRHPGAAGPDPSPVCTEVSRKLYAIDLVCPRGLRSFALLSSYEMQLSVRVDERSACIYYDCFEYKPEAFDIEKEDPPTLRQLREFEQMVYSADPRMRLAHRNVLGLLHLEESNPHLDEAVLPRDGYYSHGRDMTTLWFKVIAAEFLNSNLWRIKVPLSSVVGIRLEKTAEQPGTHGGTVENERDMHGILVLELRSPVQQSDNGFTSRRVGSTREEDNRFRRVADWTPDGVASRATRHYIYGSVGELKELTSHLCCIDAAIERMFSHVGKKGKSTTKGQSNSLSWPNTLAGIGSDKLKYQTAPIAEYSDDHSEFDNQDEGSGALPNISFPDATAWNGKIKHLKWVVVNRICDLANSGEEDDLRVAMMQSQALGLDLMGSLEIDSDEEPDHIPDY